MIKLQWRQNAEGIWYLRYLYNYTPTGYFREKKWWIIWHFECP